MAAALGRCAASTATILQSHSTTFCRIVAVRSYAKKLVSKAGAGPSQKKKMEVETDPEKLLNYCCGANVFIEGNDPELKADSEYPEWLWQLRTERGGPDLSELDPDTAQYWQRISRLTTVRNQRIKKRLQKLRDIQFPDDKV